MKTYKYTYLSIHIKKTHFTVKPLGLSLRLESKKAQKVSFHNNCDQKVRNVLKIVLETH